MSQAPRHPAERPTGGAGPGWLRPTRGEPRYAVSLAILLTVALQLSLPSRIAPQPRYLLPGLEVLLLLALVVANPGRVERRSGLLRAGGLLLAGLVAAANGISVALLVRDLLFRAGAAADAPALLAAAAAVWLVNVLAFALLYWELDRGGPAARAIGGRAYPDLLFPQMGDPHLAGTGWAPTIVDYLFVSFTASTAFSPTDTLPLTRWAKMLMLTQSAVSFLTLALVLARAVNVLGA